MRCLRCTALMAATAAAKADRPMGKWLREDDGVQAVVVSVWSNHGLSSAESKNTSSASSNMMKRFVLETTETNLLQQYVAIHIHMSKNTITFCTRGLWMAVWQMDCPRYPTELFLHALFGGKHTIECVRTKEGIEHIESHHGKQRVFFFFSPFRQLPMKQWHFQGMRSSC